MSILSNAINKLKQRNSLANNYEDDMRAQIRASNKFKSANERELESYEKEDHDKMVKLKLDYYRKKRNEEANRPFMIDKKNIFTGHANLFFGGKAF